MNQDINDSIVYNIKALMITKTSDIEEIEQTHLLGLFLYKKQIKNYRGLKKLVKVNPL